MDKNKKLKKFLEEGTSSTRETVEMLSILAGGPMTLGKAIRAFRQMNELRQEDLAMALGVVKQTISKIEKGSYIPPFELVIRIAENLKIKPESLLKYLIGDMCSAVGYKLLNFDVKMVRDKRKSA